MARQTLDDDDDDRPAKPRKPAKPAAAPPPIKMLDDDESPYAVVKDSAEEEAIAKKNRTGFGRVEDKFVRSARGPAAALLVVPSNLLLGQGALTGLIGIAMLVLGAWPLIFTDVPTADDEFADQMGIIFLGIVFVAWAPVVCYGAF